MMRPFKLYLIMWRNYPYLLASFITVLFPALFLAGGVVPEIAMSTIAALFLVHSFINKDWYWCHRKWVWCLAILWLYMMARSLFTPHIGESLSHSAVFVRYFVFAAALAYWTFRDPQTQRKFMVVLTATVLFLITDGLFQYFAGHDLLGFRDFGSPAGHVRLSGTFRKPILGIMTAWLCFPVFLKLLAPGESKNTGFKLLMTVLVAFFAIAVVSLSGERMALLLMLLGWGIALLLMPAYRVKIIAVFVAGFIAIAGTAAMDPLVLKRQEGSTVKTLENWWDSPYGMLLKTDLQMADINPVFGIGAYQFRIICPTLYPGMNEEELKSVCNIHPHNNIYLEWFIENGVIGLSLFIAFLVMIFGKCFKNWEYARNNPLFIGFLIAFIMRIWPIASTTGLSSRWGASPFWLVLGCLLAFLPLVREKERKA